MAQPVPAVSFTAKHLENSAALEAGAMCKSDEFEAFISALPNFSPEPVAALPSKPTQQAIELLQRQRLRRTSKNPKSSSIEHCMEKAKSVLLTPYISQQMLLTPVPEQECESTQCQQINELTATEQYGNEMKTLLSRSRRRAIQNEPHDFSVDGDNNPMKSFLDMVGCCNALARATKRVAREKAAKQDKKLIARQNAERLRELYQYSRRAQVCSARLAERNDKQKLADAQAAADPAQDFVEDSQRTQKVLERHEQPQSIETVQPSVESEQVVSATHAEPCALGVQPHSDAPTPLPKRPRLTSKRAPSFFSPSTSFETPQKNALLGSSSPQAKKRRRPQAPLDVD